MKPLALLLPLLLPTLALAAPWSRMSEPALLTVDEAFQLEPVTWRAGILTVSIRVTPGHYLYRDKLKLDTGTDNQALTLPQGERYDDPHFGAVVIYRQDLRAEARLASAPTEVTVRWQGCADIGVCYPPQQRTVDVDVLP